MYNVGQRQSAADLQIKPTDLGCKSACYGCRPNIHHRGIDNSTLAINDFKHFLHKIGPPVRP